MKLGEYVYGLAAIATGVIDIVWGGFERAHQPLQAWGDNIPGSRIFAYIVAIALIVGGAAVLRRQSARLGAVLLGIVYVLFAIFWLPRFYWGPLVNGQHAGIYIGVLGGVCQQLIVVGAALLIYGVKRVDEWARWLFGICAIDFGLTHLTGIAAAAPLVPKWLPPSQDFWVVFTGVAFVLAGVAILTKIVNVLAARLLALMFLIFSAFALAPNIVAYPHNQIAWGANAYNLIVVASVWIYASWLAAHQPVLTAARRAAAVR